MDGEVARCELFFGFEKSQKRAPFVLGAVLMGLALRAAWRSSASSWISSRLRKANAARRFERSGILRLGKAFEPPERGLTGEPKSKLGKKDSGAGAVMGCGRDRLDIAGDATNKSSMRTKCYKTRWIQL